MATSQPPLQLSDLIFSDAKTDFNKILGDLKRSTLSLHNRLKSISLDATFAASVAESYRLPLVANERCGSWYIPPTTKGGSAYFKSTDGHMSQWSFSLRRLNLQVLDVVVAHGGCVAVDSTRRGKSMPDALSKTVPIWTCVLNRFLFPERPDCHTLRTPPSVISASEHAQIASRIPEFVEALQGLNLDLEAVKSRVKKPLRPIWVTQESSLPDETPVYNDFYPIVCCTCSRRVPGGEASEGGYIQGAGDDAESWAFGLTPPLFWANRDILMQASEEELPILIKHLVSDAGVSGDVDGGDQVAPIKPTTFLFITNISHAETSAVSPTDFDILITAAPTPSQELLEKFKSKYLNLACAAGKVGSRQLRHQLSLLPPFLSSHLSNQIPSSVNATATATATSISSPKILVACPTGKDHSIGIALSILCLLAQNDGSLRPDVSSIVDHASDSSLNLSKHVIKQRLSWISMVLPEANPSRTTLQSVNAFLLG